MGKEKRPFYCHQNFVPKGLSAPAMVLYTCIKTFKYIPGPGVRWVFTGTLVLWSLMLIPSNNIMSEIRHPYDLGFCFMRWMSLWPKFHGWVILLNIMKTIWWVDVKPLDNEWVWCNLWPQNKCRSQWPVFHGSVILSFILTTNWYMKVILEIPDQYDTKIYFIKCM